MKVIEDVCESACGAHKFGYNMKWLIYRYGCYWPTVTIDWFASAKGYEACQLHGPIQRVPN